MKRFVFVSMIGLCTFTCAFAQLSTNELPVSFDKRLSLVESNRDRIPIITMPKLDMKKIEAEDRENEAKDSPYRFGYSHKVTAIVLVASFFS